VPDLRLPKFDGYLDGGNMKRRFLKAAFTAVAAGGLLAGCATTVDWGGPLGHYRYHYDSRPVVYSSDTGDAYYHEHYRYDDHPVVSFYHPDDDD
jgi:hypothetical protein